ncbi:hypothetical protein Pmani_013330 [Petrolisthes manimaculis]|uniref:Uncharacterized protein n=1 Tax=Petrolisthes manimaculis TaxID=1843537 RepID=A0AAE1PW60_9EUCA|nr:hypothetical protein Pmani_013330 [Petrolisthes manimaculis]
MSIASTFHTTSARNICTAGRCNRQQVRGGWGGLSTSSAERAVHHVSHKGEEHGQLKFGDQKVKTVPELPDSSTYVWPAFFTKKKLSLPQSGVTHPDTSLLKPQLAMEI